jgi:phosphatidylglycerophosphatase A
MSHPSSSSSTTSSTVPVIVPTMEWIRHSVHSFIAFGLGSGLSPFAPGTAGSIAALPLFWISGLWLFSPKLKFILLIMFFIYGCIAADYTGKKLGEADHKGIVIDEIWAMWALFCIFPYDLFIQCVVLVIFRVFDILKPYPIKQLEERFNNGFGVMIDDALAAVYAMIVSAVLLSLLSVLGFIHLPSQAM